MSTPHIMVVDDEADIRSLLQEILSDEGYEVRVAADAAQARDKLIAAGALDAEEDARITAELTREIDAAFDHAKAAALPVPDDAWAHVYAPASPTRAASA